MGKIYLSHLNLAWLVGAEVDDFIILMKPKTYFINFSHFSVEIQILLFDFCYSICATQLQKIQEDSAATTCIIDNLTESL